MLLHPALFALCPWPSSLPLHREAGDAKQWGKGEEQARGSKVFLLVGRRSENEARAEAWKRGAKGAGLSGRRG